MPKRKDVNQVCLDVIMPAIADERDYQERRWGIRQTDGTFEEVPHEVPAFLTYMRHYLAKADAAASETSGNTAALEQIMKVVTLGVACMQQHGVPKLDRSNVVNGRDGFPA